MDYDQIQCLKGKRQHVKFKEFSRALFGKTENHLIWHWEPHMQGSSVMGIITAWY